MTAPMHSLDYEAIFADLPSLEYAGPAIIMRANQDSVRLETRARFGTSEIALGVVGLVVGQALALIPLWLPSLRGKPRQQWLIVGGASLFLWSVAALSVAVELWLARRDAARGPVVEADLAGRRLRTRRARVDVSLSDVEAIVYCEFTDRRSDDISVRTCVVASLLSRKLESNAPPAARRVSEHIMIFENLRTGRFKDTVKAFAEVVGVGWNEATYEIRRRHDR